MISLYSEVRRARLVAVEAAPWPKSLIARLVVLLTQNCAIKYIAISRPSPRSARGSLRQASCLRPSESEPQQPTTKCRGRRTRSSHSCARPRSGPSRRPLSAGDPLPSPPATVVEPWRTRDPGLGDTGATRSASRSSLPPAACQRGAPCLVLARVRCRMAASNVLCSVRPACLSCAVRVCLCTCAWLFLPRPVFPIARCCFSWVGGGTLFWYYVFVFDPAVACRASAGASRAASTPCGRAAVPVPARARAGGLAVAARACAVGGACLSGWRAAAAAAAAAV